MKSASQSDAISSQETAPVALPTVLVALLSDLEKLKAFDGDQSKPLRLKDSTWSTVMHACLGDASPSSLQAVLDEWAAVLNLRSLTLQRASRLLSELQLVRDLVLRVNDIDCVTVSARRMPKRKCSGTRC